MSADDDWRNRAACLDADPELFHPIGTGGPAKWQTKEAKKVCGRCEVRDECLEFALEHLRFGIAGGLGEDEREALKRRRRRKAVVR